jgi:hypothetical protein
MSLDADDGKTLLVVVLTNPHEVYVTKDSKYVGHLTVDGGFAPGKGAAPLSGNEIDGVTQRFVELGFALLRFPDPEPSERTP